MLRTSKRKKKNTSRLRLFSSGILIISIIILIIRWADSNNIKKCFFSFFSSLKDILCWFAWHKIVHVCVIRKKNGTKSTMNSNFQQNIPTCVFHLFYQWPCPLYAFSNSSLEERGKPKSLKKVHTHLHTRTHAHVLLSFRVWFLGMTRHCHIDQEEPKVWTK